MLKDKKYKHHKHQTLKTNSYFLNLIHVFDKLIPLFNDLQNSNHSCHSDDFVKFSYSGDSCKSVIVSKDKNQVKWDYWCEIYKKPTFKVAKSYYLKFVSRIMYYSMRVNQVIIWIIVCADKIEKNIKKESHVY